MEKLHYNLIYLASAADLQSNSRFALREHRELISKEDLQDFYSRYPMQDSLFVRILRLLILQMSEDVKQAKHFGPTK
jgi:hypothetical protein